jgi:hypothetical protein
MTPVTLRFDWIDRSMQSELDKKVEDKTFSWREVPNRQTAITSHRRLLDDQAPIAGDRRLIEFGAVPILWTP